MALVALAVWCFIVALAGGLVGLVLGNLRLPLMLLVASSPAAGAGANLAVSAVSAATAAIAHVRAGRINWRLVAWMTPPSIGAAVVGGWLAGEVPRRGLLIGIAAVLLFSGVQLLRGPQITVYRSNGKLDIRAAVLSGAGIGLLGGFVGLILGSLRMPALMRLVGEVPARAVGTNVTIGAGVGVAGALGHGFSVAPDLTAAAVGAASIPGALLGARLTGRLSEPQLVRAIGSVLLVAGLATGLEAL